MKRNFTFVIIIGMVIGIMACADLSSPEIETRKFENVPLTSLKFYPNRKYIVVNDTMALFVEGIKSGFVCTKIEKFELISDSLMVIPRINVLYPKNPNTCNLESAKGKDTIINYVFSDSAWQAMVLAKKSMYLGVSRMNPTDTAYLSFSERDSVFLAQKDFDPTPVFGLHHYRIPLLCSDSLNYGFYCRDSLVDGVLANRLRVKALISGFANPSDSSTQCDSTYFSTFSSTFFADSSRSKVCDTLLISK